MAIRNLTLITGNSNKVAEFARLLNFDFNHERINLPEIQTTDVREVVREKAESAYEKLRKPVLVDDAGLVVESWNELPGALIKWFIENVGVAGIINMLGDSPRAAHVVAALGYCDKNGVKVFTGKTFGEIADTPRGENGFGFDAIFIPARHDKTFAEMSSKEKDKISHRGKAVKKMKEELWPSND